MQHYISDSIYGLTLAWITSENSTKQLEYRHLLTRSSLLDPIFSATVSGVDRICPCPVANCLSAPFSNQLSSCVPLPLPATPRFQVQKPFVWFRAKTDKGIVCLAGHLYSVTEGSCSFEPEIIKIGQSPRKMYSNNILNYQESTTIVNACTKKVWKHIKDTKYIYLFLYVSRIWYKANFKQRLTGLNLEYSFY